LGQISDDRGHPGEMHSAFTGVNFTVVDIVVQYEAKFGEEWHPIVRYDCSHGFLHRDVMFFGNKKEKHPLDIPDFKTALLYAEQDIKDRWKWYRDRYRRRLRK